ncbi:hypothetical protein K458DRAFT_322119, partial [Lentithecium fluviatile CBS 122367]
KIAFKTYYRYFKYLVILFSLTNAPITFYGLLDYTYVIYLNNILIFSKDKNNYKRYV